MKKIIFTFFVTLIVTSAQAVDECFKRDFLENLPVNSKSFHQYLGQNFGKLIYLIDAKDPSAYTAGFRVLSGLYKNSSIQDNEEEVWKIHMLANFLSFREDDFEENLSKMSQEEIRAIFNLYEMADFRDAQPSDYPDIKHRVRIKINGVIRPE